MTGLCFFLSPRDNVCSTMRLANTEKPHRPVAGEVPQGPTTKTAKLSLIGVGRDLGTPGANAGGGTKSAVGR